MSFALPLGLLGLLALPVVLALHLMRKRERRKVVSSLLLWAFLEAEVRGSKPRRVPLTWLLALDLLAAGLLGLALAQPHLKVAQPVLGPKQVLVLLDTSTSMLARDDAPTRFIRAKADVAALLGGLRARDTAALITFGARPHWIGDTRVQTVEELLASLAAVPVGETGSALSEALALGLAQEKGSQPVEVHIFSDAAFSDPGLEETGAAITWHLYGRESSNQAVVDLSTQAAADGSFQVFARLVNFADHPVSRGITLMVDGNIADSNNYVMPANSITPQVWYQEGTPQVVAVMMAGADLLAEDDRASTGFQSGIEAKIVVVEDGLIPPTGEGVGSVPPAGGAEDPSTPAGGVKSKSAVTRAVETAAGYAVEPTLPGEYFERPSTDLTVFHSAVVERYPPGTSLVIMPGQAGRDLVLPGGTLAARSSVTIPGDAVLQIAADDPLLAGLDFGGVRWGRARQFSTEGTGFISLVSVQLEGSSIPLLLRKSAGEGDVYLLTVDLERGNLTRHPVFPILLAKLAQAAVQNPLPGQILLGEAIPLPDSGSYRSVALSGPGLERQVFQQAWPGAFEKTFLPGDYVLELEDREGTQSSFFIGANAGSLGESNIVPRAWVNDRLRLLTLSRDQGDLNLTPWLLGLAILCLLAEAALAWR